MDKAGRFCTFLVGDRFFGVPVGEVQEVIRYQDMTSVPLAPEVIRGLMNLRGQIVTAIDLRRCLATAGLAAGQLPMNVVVRTEEGPVSLLVDEIRDVVEVQEDTFEEPPESLGPDDRQLISGVHKLDGHLMCVLNTKRACAIDKKTADT